MRPLGAMLLALLILQGCGGSSSSSTFTPAAATALGIVDVIHESSDAPAVDLVVNDSPAFTNLDYQQAVVLQPEVGTITVAVEGVLPDQSAPVVIGPADIPVSEGTRETILAVDTLANIAPLVLSQSVSNISSGQVQVRVVHAAPNAPMVDVYVSAPNTDITTEAPLGTFEFTGVLGPVEVPAGDYQLSVTIAGDPAAIVFQVNAGLPADQDVIVAAVTNVAVGDSPINLIVAAVDPNAPTVNQNVAATLLDADTPAQLRVVHVSPDAPNVDVIANDDISNPVVTNLEYASFTDFLTLPAGDINAKVVPTGEIAPVVIDADITLTAGNAFTVLATDILANISPLLLTDELRRVSSEAQVRIVHGSPTAGNVDLYVVAPGTDINTVEPAFSNVSFQAETGYVGLIPGDYDVVVTPTGTTNAAIGPVTITVSGGGLYTAIARDEVGIGLPLGLILLDDFNL